MYEEHSVFEKTKHTHTQTKGEEEKNILLGMNRVDNKMHKEAFIIVHREIW